MDWEAIRSVANVVSSICAIIAAIITVRVWRKALSSDLGTRIETGDKSVKAHADAAIGRLEETVDELRAQLGGFADAIARIEAHQETEGEHVLRPRDLGAIHEKINRIAEELAGVRAASSAETRMLSEQLKLIQQLLMKRLEH